MIDNLPSQTKVHQLLRKTTRSKQENQELVLALKKGAYDMPDVTFSITYQLAKNKQNTSDQSIVQIIKKIEYKNIEQLILNAIKIKIPLTTIRKYLQHFAKQIGKTHYLEKLSAFVSFAVNKGHKEDLQNIIKDDLSDLDSRKRILTASKKQGRIDEYIKKLNSYLQENPNDTEVWIELCQLYTQKGLYLRALFCMQEIVLNHPDNDHYTLKLAELYVTLGGKNDIKHAIKYYSHVITRSPKNVRALWGLYRVLQSMGDKIDSQYAELKELCSDTINNQYSKRNPSLKIHVAF